MDAPLTRGFLLHFEGLKVLDAAGDDIGIREIQLKNTMKGKGKVDGKSRIPLGYVPGSPDWMAAVKSELTYWTRWAQRNPGYADRIIPVTFDYLSAGCNYTIELIGCTYQDEDHTANKGSESGLEKAMNFFVLDVVQTVDGVEIPYLGDTTQ